MFLYMKFVYFTNRSARSSTFLLSVQYVVAED